MCTRVCGGVIPIDGPRDSGFMHSCAQFFQVIKYWLVPGEIRWETYSWAAFAHLQPVMRFQPGDMYICTLVRAGMRVCVFVHACVLLSCSISVRF